MRRQVIITTVAALMLAFESFAQIAITSKNNGYRDGDNIYRILANDTVVGDRGENCVWRLPSAQKGDNCFRQSIFLKNDSLTIAEGDFLLQYIATENEVLMYGFQKRDIYAVQDKLLPEIIFPFAYGDSIADTYSRKSTYFDMFSIEGDGSCYTVCDGMGVLTDGEETLNDVIRIHHHNTIVSKYNTVVGDSKEQIEAVVTEDKYLWYCNGCRYPVMDTRVISSTSNGELVSDTTFTSLYMPELQLSELAYDVANYGLIAKKESLKQLKDISDNDMENQFPIKMSASLQGDERQILLDYRATEKIDCYFYAHDLAGRLLGSITHVSVGEGEYHESLILRSRPINSIVMITIVAGDMKQVVKVR